MKLPLSKEQLDGLVMKFADNVTMSIEDYGNLTQQSKLAIDLAERLERAEKVIEAARVIAKRDDHKNWSNLVQSIEDYDSFTQQKE